MAKVIKKTKLEKTYKVDPVPIPPLRGGPGQAAMLQGHFMVKD